MPLNSIELGRARGHLADLQRRMNLSKPETIEDIQKEISALTDIVASILNLLDKSIGDAKRVTR